MVETIALLQIITSLSFNGISSNNYCTENKKLDSDAEITNVSKTYTREINERSLNDYDVDDYLRENIVNNLVSNNPDYQWSSSGVHKTNQISNGIPVSVYGNTFYDEYEIREAIRESGIPSLYGGCGPIALIGILDYFSRTLGYSEIIDNPYSSDERIQLAVDVFEEVRTYELGFGSNQTLTFPDGLKDGFNNLINSYGLSDYLSATCRIKVVPFFQNVFWDAIVENIDSGLPVTLMVAFSSVIGRPCGEHCTNVFGYETLIGYNQTTGETIEKQYLIVRVNWPGYESEYYCDAEVLAQPFVSLIEYQINYTHDFSATAVDFANDFVNSNGNGQYFYYNIPATIYLDENTRFNTNRLRCSYIENQYIVLSPKRLNAGTAYLEFGTFSATQKFSFTASMWGPLEDHENEIFKLQYYKNSQWLNHISINLSVLSKNKENPDSFTVLFPRSTHQFRFLATHSNPVGERNRGRIVLDNFNFEYHFT